MESNVKSTVFVVDDNDTFLSQFDAALKNHYNVITASSGSKMFNILEKVTPHLIVLDIEMPEMDGFEILSKLKASKDHSGIPVIFLSGVQDAAMETKGFRMGVADFIEKPFTAPIVSNRIKLQLNLQSLKKNPVNKKDIDIPKPEPKTIFAVDDSDTILSQIEKSLKNHYNVMTMSSGKKMFSILEKVTPHLIMLDIEMPEMDGFEILSKLKANKDHSGIPVIFLSGVQDATMETKGFRMGVADFIEKPFTAPIVSNRIRLQLQLLDLKKNPKSTQR